MLNSNQGINPNCLYISKICKPVGLIMAKSVDSIKKKKVQKSSLQEKLPQKLKKEKSKILAKLNEAANRPIKIKLTRTHYLIFGSIFTIFVLYFIFCVASYLTLKDRIYPNVWVGGVNVGNKTPASAQEILSQKILGYIDSTTLIFTSEKETFQLNPKDIEAKIDFPLTSQKMMSIGHNQNFLYAGLIRLRLLVKPIKLAAVVNFNQEKLNQWLTDISKNVEVPFRNASLKIENGEIVEIPSSTGVKLEKNVLVERIKNEIGNFSNQKIVLPLEVSCPVIENEDLADARTDAEKMFSAPIEIIYKDKKYTADIDIISKWITFAEVPKTQILGVKATSNIASAISSDNELVLVAKLDEKKIKEYIDKIAGDLDVEPKNAGLAFSNGGLKVISPSVTGRVVDKEQLYLDIKNAVKNDSYRKINIKIITKFPDVREDNLNSLGIIEQISEGVSSTAGSPANRLHNIRVGAAKFNGVLIKPDEIFSFNTTLGPVNASTGYLPELVIKENKTIPEYGGGLCQISTTAFRAALLAGLSIIERHPHAYLVKYYYWPYGPGVDATIYPPSPDLKFKNDTGSWILIQTRVEGSKVYFDFYGNSGGKKGVINKPQILWSRPDGSAGVVFTRDVFVNGVKIRTDTFNSIYKSPSLYPHPVVETGAPAQ